MNKKDEQRYWLIHIVLPSIHLPIYHLVMMQELTVNQLILITYCDTCANLGLLVSLKWPSELFLGFPSV
jgi:hypothetical protein